MAPRKTFRSPYRITVGDAIDCMVATLGRSGPDVLLVSTIDEQGFVGPGDCFDLSKTFPSTEVIFQLPVSLDAPLVLCGSRATRSVLEPDERDLELTRWLLAGAEKYGVVLDEHILVQRQTFRFMRESIEEGLC